LGTVKKLFIVLAVVGTLVSYQVMERAEINICDSGNIVEFEYRFSLGGIE
jgi:hypothetical protein